MKINAELWNFTPLVLCKLFMCMALKVYNIIYPRFHSQNIHQISNYINKDERNKQKYIHIYINYLFIITIFIHNFLFNPYDLY